MKKVRDSEKEGVFCKNGLFRAGPKTRRNIMKRKATKGHKAKHNQENQQQHNQKHQQNKQQSQQGKNQHQHKK